MDTKKQPGIKPIAIMLLECNFTRYPELVQSLHTDCKLSYSNNCLDDGKGQGILTIAASGVCEISKKKAYDASIKFIGIFEEVGEDANLPLDQFMTVHAPAHIYPYLREFLSSLSMRSGLPTIILPPLNMAALLHIDIEGSIKQNNEIVADQQ